MKAPNNHSSLIEETDADRRRGLLAGDSLSLDLVSAFSGDRALTEAEKEYFAELEKHRGSRFFSDLFYAITHQHFPPPRCGRAALA
jgi:hypothetical protein